MDMLSWKHVIYLCFEIDTSLCKVLRPHNVHRLYSCLRWKYLKYLLKYIIFGVKSFRMIVGRVLDEFNRLTWKIIDHMLIL